jgi:hypothetical protein
MSQWSRVKKDFFADVAKRYEQHCKRHSVVPTQAGLLEYVHTIGLIYEADISLYMVKALYPEALYRHNCKKMRAVYELEQVLPLDERRIRRAIKSERSFSFEKNKGRSRRKSINK